MRFYKLRVTPNATKIASTFNEQFKPEKIAEHNDYQTEWIDGSCGDEVLIGEKVRRFLYKESMRTFILSPRPCVWWTPLPRIT